MSWLWVALAWGAPTDAVQLCVTVRTRWADAELGDFWTDDSVPKPARGLHLSIEGAEGRRRSVVLSDDTGCAEVPLPTPPVRITAHSRITVQGVDAVASPDHRWREGVAIPVRAKAPPVTEAALTWTVDGVGDQALSLEIPSDQVWQALAATGFLLSRSDFHLNEPAPVPCCALKSGAQRRPDGTCSDRAAVLEPVRPPIVLFTGEAPGVRSCGRSGPHGQLAIQFPDGSSVDSHPAVHVSCRRKRILAHELGHVIAAMRVGARERRSKEAPVDGCVANFDGKRAPYTPGDSDHQRSRGNLSKEYTSEAMKEGWAEFVGIWAWNDPTERDCDYDTTSDAYDFDLDRTMDSVDGVARLSCLGWPDPAAPKRPAPGGWLGEAVDQGFGPGWGFDEKCHASRFEANRSTVFDVGTMFWSLAAHPQRPVPAADLLDAYVGACPDTWAPRDACKSPEELPAARLRDRLRRIRPAAAEAVDRIQRGALRCE